jgi:hypothetical protein
MKKDQLSKTLLMMKPYSGKFIFCACLIVFTVILLHIFPIKVVIDTRTMRHSRRNRSNKPITVWKRRSKSIKLTLIN